MRTRLLAALAVAPLTDPALRPATRRYRWAVQQQIGRPQPNR